MGCIPLAVVVMTTANRMQPTFVRKTKLFIISDLYRQLMEIADVHYIPVTLTVTALAVRVVPFQASRFQHCTAIPYNCRVLQNRSIER